MPKTYNTIPQVATGDLLTATAWNNQATNINNLRVPPMCIVRRAAAQSFTNNASATITFDTLSLDTDPTMFTASSDTVTIQTAGIYVINGAIYWASNATGVRSCGFVITGATYTQSVVPNSDLSAISGFAMVQHVTGIIPLNAGATVKLQGYQNSGGALNATNAQMQLVWVGQVS